jgi:hypothetical protein
MTPRRMGGPAQTGAMAKPVEVTPSTQLDVNAGRTVIRGEIAHPPRRKAERQLSAPAQL